MRLLLTGATGFIGAVVLDCLIKDGHSITVLVVPETLRHLRQPAQVRVVLGELHDQHCLSKATRDVEVVLHLAGKISGRSLSDLVDVNVHGTANLLRACISNGVRRMVFVSSASVYRPTSWAELPITETSPVGPAAVPALRAYGQSKITAEHLVLECHRKHGQEFSILRPTTAFGISEGSSARAIEEFLMGLLKNARVAFSGMRQRMNMQWVHVSDLAQAIVCAAVLPASKNQVFTIAGEELFDVPELTAIMLDILSSGRPRISRLPLVLRRYPHVLFDIGKARRLLGYVPRVDLRTGLSQLLENMEARGQIPLFCRR